MPETLKASHAMAQSEAAWPGNGLPSKKIANTANTANTANGAFAFAPPNMRKP